MSITYSRETLQGLPSSTSINDELEKIETALDKAIDRNGGSDNEMQANLDMNSNRIINVADPVGDNDVATKSYLETTFADYLSAADAATAAEAAQTAAETAQTAAETAQTGAETAEANAEAVYDNFDDRYLGAKSSEPTLDNDGDALQTGALFFDTTANVMKVYDGSLWQAITTTSGAVDSVFGRTGTVTAQASDYDADQVDYDNTSSGLTATDVQAAIDEVNNNASAPVSSVFGRTGAVVAASSDYDADQVDFDDTGFPFTATEVQDAIKDTNDRFSSAPSNHITGTPINVGGTYDEAVSSDGTNLLTAESGLGIRKFVGFSNTVDTTINPTEDTDDIAWDSVNSNLVGCDQTLDEVYEFDGFSTTVLNTYSISNPLYIDVDYKGNLHVYDSVASEVEIYSGVSASLSSSFSVPAAPDGLAVIGDLIVVFYGDGVNTARVYSPDTDGDEDCAKIPYDTAFFNIGRLGDELLAIESGGDVSRFYTAGAIEGQPLAPADNNWSQHSVRTVNLTSTWPSTGGTETILVEGDNFPGWYRVYLENTSAEKGYAVGDIVDVTHSMLFDSGPNTSYGTMVTWDDSSNAVDVRIASGGITIIHGTSFDVTVVTPASWDLKFQYIPNWD